MLFFAWLRAIYDVIKYDFCMLHLLQADDLQVHVPRSLRSTLQMPQWLKAAVLVAPLLATCALLINLWHVKCFVTQQKTESEALYARRETLEQMEARLGAEGIAPMVLSRCRVNSNGVDRGEAEIVAIDIEATDFAQVKVRYSNGCQDWVLKQEVVNAVEGRDPWCLRMPADMTLLVIMMPAAFAVLALRAEIRILQVFLGTGFEGHDPSDWSSFKLWREGTYSADLECAAAFQYLTVLAFIQLCKKFFSLAELSKRVEITENTLRLRCGYTVESHLKEDVDRADKAHYTILAQAGLQGLYCYTLVGVLRCVLNLATIVWSLTHSGRVCELGVEAMEYFQPVFVFTAVLCIYNWGVIQSLDDLKRPEALGKNATCKFIGVRFLLLIGDGQKGILALVAKKWPDLLSREQGELLHALLLAAECLLVVGWNYFQWPRPVRFVEDAPNNHKLKRAMNGGEADAARSTSRRSSSASTHDTSWTYVPPSVTNMGGP